MLCVEMRSRKTYRSLSTVARARDIAVGATNREICVHVGIDSVEKLVGC